MITVNVKKLISIKQVEVNDLSVPVICIKDAFKETFQMWLEMSFSKSRG